MDAVLSVQGASAPVKKKSFFSKFTRLNMLRLARAVIPAAVLMMFFPQLAMAAGSSGQDLMASGNCCFRYFLLRCAPVYSVFLFFCPD